jgi:hypothetical protein
LANKLGSGESIAKLYQLLTKMYHALASVDLSTAEDAIRGCYNIVKER